MEDRVSRAIPHETGGRSSGGMPAPERFAVSPVGHGGGHTDGPLAQQLQAISTPPQPVNPPDVGQAVQEKPEASQMARERRSARRRSRAPKFEVVTND